MFFVIPPVVFAQVISEDDPHLKGINVDEHLGVNIPLDLEFTNEGGQKVKLRDYFQADRPVIMTLAYYECPMLCTMVLNGISDGVRKLEWLPGEQFQMLTVSIDPTETPALASRKRDNHLKEMGKPVSPSGWAFLVGQQPQIQALAATLGFQYYYDKENDEYAHPAVVFLLSPDGKISRYLYGLEHEPKNLKLGLLEASEGKIGTTLEKLLLYCYHYDPQAGGYVIFAINVMRLGGVLTVIGLIFFIGLLWSKEKFRGQPVPAN